MSKHTTHTIAFYNIENLFDTQDDTHTNDDAFLPHADKRWTTERYRKKLRKLGHVIAQIGEDDIDTPPAIVGLAEVENRRVVRDLIKSKYLKYYDYDIAHFDSPDERGIDVALIFDATKFEVSNAEPFSVYLEKENGTRDYTRDVLLVTGRLQGKQIHIIVNHWSSRRDGQNETEHKRIAAAETVNRIITSLKTNYDRPQIIVMGDFNDNPNDKSIQLMEDVSELYNPFKTINRKEKGSLSHNFEWHLFDQILVSTNFFDATNSPFSIENADVFNSKFLTQYRGKYKDQPFRTYAGKRYKGGYSDHFPVYIEVEEDD